MRFADGHQCFWVQNMIQVLALVLWSVLMMLIWNEIREFEERVSSHPGI